MSCATKPLWPQDPEATLDYDIDWKNWIVSGRQLVSVEYRVAFAHDPQTALGPEDLQILENEVGGTKTVVWLEGGVVGVTYEVTARVTDDNPGTPRVDERSFFIAIQDL